MVDTRDLTVFNDMKSLDSTAVLHRHALEAKTDSEYGDERVFRDMPDVLHYPDVFRIVWRARTRSDDDSVEVPQERDEGSGGESIVLNDMDVASRDSPFAKRG